MNFSLALIRRPLNRRFRIVVRYFTEVLVDLEELLGSFWEVLGALVTSRESSGAFRSSRELPAFGGSALGRSRELSEASREL